MFGISPENAKLIRIYTSRLLTTDAYDLAEQVTGKKFDMDFLTQRLGSAGEQFLNFAREELMKQTSDTFWGMKWDSFMFQLSIHPDFEWRNIYEEKYKQIGSKKEGTLSIFIEIHYGILLVVSELEGYINHLNAYMQISTESTNKLKFMEEGDQVKIREVPMAGNKISENVAQFHFSEYFGLFHWMTIVFIDKEANPVSPWISGGEAIFLPGKEKTWTKENGTEIFESSNDKIKKHFEVLLRDAS
jgi:hypothetical protein